MNKKAPFEKELSGEDIVNLKYQCRAGYVVGFLFFLLGIIGEFLHQAVNNFNVDLVPVIPFVSLLLGVLVAFLMMRKYRRDIKNGTKFLSPKKVKLKESNIDFEAGNSRRGKFTSYHLLIDNYKYKVEKELFDAVNEGDELLMHRAPISNILLAFEMKESGKIYRQM